MIDFIFDPENFHLKYFEKDFFHLKSCFDPAAYDWGKFNEDFYSIEPALGTVRLFKDGNIPRSSFQVATQVNDEVAHNFDQAKVSDILSQGGSMVINRFEKNSKHVADVCNAVSNLCGHATVGNAYVTKGGSGTFGKHWDAHCVFAVQLIGKKRWTLHRPSIDRPLNKQEVEEHVYHEETEIVFDDVIEAGDVLYIPRGWWHTVTPLTNQPSLHIATGVHTPKVIDYLKWVLGRKMVHDVAFRETLPLASLDADKIINTISSFLEAAKNNDLFQQYLVEMRIAMSAKKTIDFSSIFNEENCNAST